MSLLIIRPSAPAPRRTPARPYLLLGLAVSLLAGAATSARAQWGVWEADSLLAAGRLAQAERLYYSTSNAAPRDPAPRAALGRFLAARGALRIGAVLLEEARQFGGDTAAIARALAPVYEALGDYRTLASLPRSPLSPAERQRAAWIGANQQTLEFADSIATVTYRPTANGEGLGVVSLRVGDRRVDAMIDPSTSGLLLRGPAARKRDGLRVFGKDSLGVVAAVPALSVGGVTLGNVPARIDDSVRGASKRRADTLSVLGLDVLRRLAPTFDPAGQTLVLRRSGQLSDATRGNRLPFLFDENGLRVLADGHWETAPAHNTALMLASRRWTLDSRRGDIILQ